MDENEEAAISFQDQEMSPKKVEGNVELMNEDGSWKEQKKEELVVREEKRRKVWFCSIVLGFKECRPNFHC